MVVVSLLVRAGGGCCSNWFSFKVFFSLVVCWLQVVLDSAVVCASFNNVSFNLGGLISCWSWFTTKLGRLLVVTGFVTGCIGFRSSLLVGSKLVLVVVVWFSSLGCWFLSGCAAVFLQFSSLFSILVV